MPSLRIVALLLLLLPSLLPAAPSYSRQVQTLLNIHCTVCHTGLTAPKRFFTTSFGAIEKTVVSGDADKSLLMKHLEGKAGHKTMPPKESSPLLPEEIELIRAWINAGARDDSEAPANKPAEVAPTMPFRAAVVGLAYDPSGKSLVAASGATLTRIDPVKGTPLDRLTLDSAITALAYRPDGKLLAVATGTPGIRAELRFFEVAADGKIAEKPKHRVVAHLDLVQALAFSPDGKTLATCGYDRLVRLWDVEAGKRVRDLKDHSDGVYGVGFSHDGKLLASAGADRAIKVWEVASGKRLFTLGEATDWVYAIAWHPTKPILAAGGVDRNIRVWDIVQAEGKLRAASFAHEGAVVRLAYDRKGETLFSLGEDRVAKAWDAVKLVERRVYDRQNETLHALAVGPDGRQMALGRHDGVVALIEAETGKAQATVAAGPITLEENAGNAPGVAQLITLTATIQGTLTPAGDLDFYRFEASVGQEIGARIALPMGSKMEPTLELVDPKGRVVAGGTTQLAHTCTEAGFYTIGLRDREFKGEPGYTYTLKVGAVPVVTSVFPPGLQRGTEGEVTLDGANLGSQRTVKVKIAADAMPGSKVPVPLPMTLEDAAGTPQVVVGEFAEQTKVGSMLAIPGTGNGRIEKPGQLDTWRFVGKKGQRLVLEILARRFGSTLDATLEVLDASDRPVPIATLRGVAKVFTTFRDNDSVTNGIRLESWNELSVNDHVLIGTEVIRILQLPRNPDDDCRFFTDAGQRLAYLGTTSTHHYLGEAMYKVEVHPAGRTFPPNGLPVVPLFARNDDGGPGYGKDSRLFFDVPADGEYRIRVGDSRGEAGRDLTYRVVVREPRPDFSVKISPAAPSVSKGSAVPVEITAERLDDFQGPIEVELLGLPAGLTAPKTTILAGENSTSLALFAAASAVLPAGDVPAFRVKATALIGGKPIEKTIPGGRPMLIEPGEIVTTTEQKEISIRPGGETRLTVVIERRAGFAGRIPIEVRGLPHGLRVLDVGLNGILITPRETRRTIILIAEPWVEPTAHPIVVTAKREGKNSDHAAPSVLLKVEKP